MSAFSYLQEVIVFDNAIAVHEGGILGYHGRIVGETDQLLVYRVYVTYLNRVRKAHASAIFAKDKSTIERMAGAVGVVTFDSPYEETSHRRAGTYRLHRDRKYQFEFTHADRPTLSIELGIPVTEGDRRHREVRALVPSQMPLTDKWIQETLAGIVCYAQRRAGRRGGRR